MKNLLTFIFLTISVSSFGQTADTNRVSGISFDGNKYQIDTAIIFRNQNLEPLLYNLENTALTTHNNTKDIPIFIKSFLRSITSSDFSIANPGENWQVGCVVMKNLPKRQLVYFGLGDDIALLSFFTGGFGKSQEVYIIKFAKIKIVDFWLGNVVGDLSNKKDILEYLKTKKK